jgi:AraC-like DNA-binding protein
MQISPDVYKRIVTAKLYIDDNFHEDIDLHLLSREACLSKFHFHRLFTHIYRRTPHRYLTQKRINQAQLLLADKRLSVTEICNTVGFESIGSFSILFKKQIGSGPQSFRSVALQKIQLAEQQPRSFIPQCFVDTYGL